MSGFPNILIYGHSFVRRVREDLDAHFDSRAAPNFYIPESGHISMLGSRGRTVAKVMKYDLSFVQKYKHDILILELGTNDLSVQVPETVGFQIDDLVHLFRDKYKIRVVCVCQVINRNLPQTQVPDHDFNAKAALLRNICP